MRDVQDPWGGHDGTSEKFISESPTELNAAILVPEGSDVDDDNVDVTYTREGSIEQQKQEGLLRDVVRKHLNSTPSDVKFIGDRKVKVDLTFLRSQEEKRRVCSIIEDCIKIYTSVPGVVKVTVGKPSGVYFFNVTNNNLSPDSDSSSIDSSPKYKAKQAEQRKKQATPAIIPELVKGIPLEPRFPGLPGYTLRYGMSGLTEANVSKLRKQHPDMELYDFLKLTLMQMGIFQKIINLYIWPR